MRVSRHPASRRGGARAREDVLRGWLYDLIFRPISGRWYAEVLDALPEGGRVLDVGIGTAGSLCSQAERVRDRDLHILGIDIDENYLERADRNLERAGLTDRVTTRRVSVYELEDGPFDAAYFGASFMLMPDPVAAARHVAGLVRPGGPIYFTQTFEERRSPLMERLKPMLFRLTTIHFGRVTYEQEFLDTLEAAGLDVEEHRRLGGGRRRSARLVQARVGASSEAA